MTILTDPQINALRVLARGHADGNHVGIATYTSEPVPDYQYLTIHWHVAQELIGMGLARQDRVCIVLTDKGIEAASKPKRGR